MRFTEKQLQQLQQEGKIKGYQVQKKCKDTLSSSRLKSGEQQKKCKVTLKQKRSKEKEWISKNLWAWCMEKGLEMQMEQRFHGERKWRFDYSIPSLMIAIEYEGLMSEKSRHTTISGFTGDSEKYNAAQALRWKILRYTAVNYKNLITDLNNIIG